MTSEGRREEPWGVKGVMLMDAAFGRWWESSNLRLWWCLHKTKYTINWLNVYFLSEYTIWCIKEISISLLKIQKKFKRENIFLILSSLRESTLSDTNIWPGCLFTQVFSIHFTFSCSISLKEKNCSGIPGLDLTWLGSAGGLIEFYISFPAELGL